MPLVLLSRPDLLEIGRQYVLSRARRIEPTQVDVEGSDINLVIGSQSYVGHAVVRQLGSGLNRLLLDGCQTEEEIDRWAFDRYQQLRKGAAAALGSVIFSRPTSAAGSGEVPAGTKLLTLNNVEYVTITDGVFGPTSLTASADVRAAKAGKEQQVGRNAIRRFDKISLLWDQTLAVNNPEPTAGGEPAETVDVFRERVRAMFIAARRGTISAIAAAATQVPGVVSSSAVEVVDPSGAAARLMRLFIADSSGIASAALAALVSTELLEWRCGGIQVLVDLSSPEIVSVVLRLRFASSVNTVTLRDAIRAAVVEFVNSLRVNQSLDLGALYAVLARFRSDGLIVSTLPGQETIVSPVGDLVPTPGRTLRTTPASVTILD